jgi:class 3 adenylate cyclase
MVECPACGVEVVQTARFCHECGTRLLPASADQTRKTVTVLFSDLTGSTALAEQLDAELVREILTRFFDMARHVIEQHGGTVDKYIGDAIMAVFGVPVLHEDDPLRAVRAAAALHEALGRLNEELERDFGVVLQVHTGVNTGEVVTGTAERLVTGDAVNIAARLQQAAVPGQILLGETVERWVRPVATVTELEPLTMRGKAAPVPAYQLVSIDAGDEARRSGRQLGSPLVGRVAEQQLLAATYARTARERTCGLITVLGDPGVGKSRLVDTFVSSLDHATVVAGRCLAYGQGITYWPVVEIVEHLMAKDPGGAVARLLADNADIAAGAKALLGETSTATFSGEIAWAVRRMLEASAAVCPVVAVVDDLHWATPTVLELIDYVAGTGRTAPVLLVCLTRLELLERCPDWGGGKPNTTSILLEPLSPEETDALVDALLAVQPPAAIGTADDLRFRIRESAGGNPLFVEEMVGLAVEASEPQLKVPPSIQALMAARLDQLPPADRRMLQCAAVEGQAFHADTLKTLVPDTIDVDSRLEELIRKDLLRPDLPSLPGGRAYRFRHILLRDAAYDGLPQLTRANLHVRFADWLVEEAPGLPALDELAGYHLEQAVRYHESQRTRPENTKAIAAAAARHLESAGLRALDRGDMSSAVDLLQRASHVAVGGDDISRGLLLADALGLSGQVEAALEHARGLADNAAVRGDRVAETKARLSAAHWLMRCDPEAGSKQMGAIIALARDIFADGTDETSSAYLWRDVADYEHRQSHFGAAFTAAVTASAQASAADLRFLAQSMNVFAAAAVNYGPTTVGDAVRWLADQQLVSPLQQIGLDLVRADLLGQGGQFDEARAIIRAATVAMAERQPSSNLPVLHSLAEWRLAMTTGDLHRAEETMRQCCERLERAGERSRLSTYVCFLAQTLYRQGRFGEAGTWAMRGKELAAADDTITHMASLQVRAKLAARTHDFSTGVAFAEEAVALAESTDSPVRRGEAHLDLAEVEYLSGRVDDAAAHVAAAVGEFERKGARALTDLARRRLAEAFALY